MENKMIINKDFKKWVSGLSKKYKQAQIKAAIRVNSELIRFYFELGKAISETSYKAEYGNQFYEKLSAELQTSLERCKGLSPVNIRYSERFYTLYNNNVQIFPQLVEELIIVPWGHHRCIIDRCKNVDEAIFYVRKTIMNNWSRALLMNFLDTNLYSREGKVLTNFELTLPEEDSDLQKQILKSTYSFDFLTFEEKYREKELKKALVQNIQDFLTELGTGFAYMGSEFRLLVGDTELYIDMLFYNTKAHAYVVVEVKTADFKSEFLGQLGTYIVAVDHQLKTDRDDKTIGILVCKYKNDVLVRLALESSSQPIGVTTYELSKFIPDNFKSSLPSIEEMEEELKEK